MAARSSSLLPSRCSLLLSLFVAAIDVQQCRYAPLIALLFAQVVLAFIIFPLFVFPSPFFSPTGTAVKTAGIVAGILELIVIILWLGMRK